jgi:hypothetical protein
LTPNGLTMRAESPRTDGPFARLCAVVEYEFSRISLPRGLSRASAQRLLSDQAEYGHWELHRVRLYPDGTRRIVLRRPIIRVVRTF